MFQLHRGKVDNLYMGDGMKFRGTCFAPPVPGEPEAYKEGPELIEVNDPTYVEEQDWLTKLEVREQQ